MTQERGRARQVIEKATQVALLTAGLVVPVVATVDTHSALARNRQVITATQPAIDAADQRIAAGDLGGYDQKIAALNQRVEVTRDTVQRNNKNLLAAGGSIVALVAGFKMRSRPSRHFVRRAR